MLVNVKVNSYRNFLLYLSFYTICERASACLYAFSNRMYVVYICIETKIYMPLNFFCFFFFSFFPLIYILFSKMMLLLLLFSFYFIFFCSVRFSENIEYSISVCMHAHIIRFRLCAFAIYPTCLKYDIFNSVSYDPSQHVNVCCVCMKNKLFF